MTAGAVRGALLSLLLSGCAAWPPPASTPPAPPSAAARAYADTIELSGRLSLQYQQDGRDESMHGSFTWSQSPRQTRLTLLSPLGQTIAIIDVQPGSATLLQSGQPPRSAQDADTLAATALGWPLPIAGLRHWLQGFAQDQQGQPWIAAPVSGAEVVTRDGWHIAYASWHDENPGRAHPRRLDLRRQTTHAGLVALRIVIDSWQTK